MVKQYYNAYSAAVQTVAKTRQIVMLYDAVLRHMAKAKVAIADHKIEERFNELSKAGEIIFGLQGCLDFEKGGEVAKLLYDFYSSIDARIFSIHRSNSLQMCDQLIAELKQMREAWHEIDTHGTESNSDGATVPAEAAASAGGKMLPPESVAVSA